MRLCIFCSIANKHSPQSQRIIYEVYWSSSSLPLSYSPRFILFLSLFSVFLGRSSLCRPGYPSSRPGPLPCHYEAAYPWCPRSGAKPHRFMYPTLKPLHSPSEAYDGGRPINPRPERWIQECQVHDFARSQVLDTASMSVHFTPSTISTSTAWVSPTSPVSIESSSTPPSS